jgi:hypothetical protein
MINATYGENHEWNQLIFAHLMYQNQPIYSTCNDWETFVKSRDLLAVVDIYQVQSINITTIKQIFDYYENHDHSLDYVECSNKTAAQQIIQLITQQGTMEGTLEISCQNHRWVIKNCTSDGIAMCIDCEDPCREHCSNERLLHFVSPCLSTQDSCVTPYGKVYGLRNSIQMLSIGYALEETPPQIVSYSSSSSSQSIRYNVVIDTAGAVACAAYAGYLQPRTYTDIDLQQQYGLAGNGSLGIEFAFSNLIPGTNYSIYCYTSTASGTKQSFPEVLQQRKYVSTTCCKTLASVIASDTLRKDSAFHNYLTIHLSHAPSQNIQINVAMSYGGNLSTNSVWPSYVTVLSNSSNLVLPFTIAPTFASNMSMFVLNVTGPGRNEFDVSYRFNNSFTVLDASSSAFSFVFALLSVEVMSDGVTLQAKFNSPTDKAGYTYQFPCDSVFIVSGVNITSCYWSDSSTAILNIRGKSIASFDYAGLLQYNQLAKQMSVSSPVDQEVILKAGILRAISCGSNFVCSTDTKTNSLQSIRITLASSVKMPQLSLSIPVTLGVCDDLLIDLTNSLVFGGGYWLNVSVLVTSARASAASLRSIQQYLDSAYVISPPSSIPRRLFEDRVSYTFFYKACNLFGLCSSIHQTLGVLDSKSPFVTIRGSNFRRVFRSERLQVFADGYMKRICSGVLSRSNLAYSWTVLRDGIVQKDIRSLSRDPSVLLVAPFTLVEGSNYAVRTRVIDSYSGISASTAASISISYSPLWVRFESPSNLFMKPGNQLDLSVISSLSYDKVAASKVSFEWSCIRLKPTVSMPCNLELVASANSTSQRSTKKIVASSTLAVGSVYVVEVLASGPNGMSSSTSVTISVVSDTTFGLSTSVLPTSILDVDRGDGAFLINSDNKLILFGNISLQSSNVDLTQYNATWSSLQLPTLESVATSAIAVEMSDANVLAVSPETGYSIFAFNLALKANSLSLGGAYSFVLKIGTWSTTVKIRVNCPPLAGFLTPSPRSGTELSTSFVLRTNGWVDDHLPLTYSFGYVDSNANRVPLSTRDMATYIRTILPGFYLGGNLPVYVQVFDFYSAMAMNYSTVSVAKNTGVSNNPTQVSSLVTSLLQSNKGDKNGLTSTVSVATSIINTVSCVAAPNCTLLNRKNCLNTADSCGACHSGYIGDFGDGNTLCVDSSAYAFTSRRLSIVGGETCKRDWDCPTILQECVNSVCTYRKQVCPAQNCNNQGTCRYRNKHTKRFVRECLITDPYCEPYCRCTSGYAGAACQLTTSEMTTLTSVRATLYSTFAIQSAWTNVLSELDLSALTLQSNELLRQDTQVNTSFSAAIFYVVEELLDISKNLSTPSDTILRLVDTINVLSSSEIPSIVNGSRFTSLLLEFTDRILQDMALGEPVINMMTSDVRVYAHLLPAYFNATHLPSIAFVTTSLEDAAGISPMSTSIPQLRHFNNSAVSIRGVQLKSRLFPAEASISNIALWWYSGREGQFALNCADGSNEGCKVTVVVPYNQHIFIIPPHEEIEYTQCYDLDHYIANYTCLTSQFVNTSSPCPGTFGKYVNRCPIHNATTVCNRFSMDSGDLYQSCIASDYNNFNVTCECIVNENVPQFANYEPIYERRALMEGAITQLNHTGVTWSTLSVGYSAKQVTFVNYFDPFFDPQEDLNSEQAIIIFVTMGSFSFLLFVLSVCFYTADSTQTEGFKRSFVESQRKLRSEQQKKEQDSLEAKIDISALKARPTNLLVQAMEDNAVYHIDDDELSGMDDDEDDDSIGSDFGAGEEHQIVVRSARHSSKKVNSITPASPPSLVQSKSQILHNRMKYTTIKLEDLAFVTEAVLNRAIPAAFSSEFTVIRHIWDEIKCYHRWWNVLFHSSVIYTRVLRVLTLGVQVLLSIFFIVTFYFLANPDDGSCAKYTNGRSCSTYEESKVVSGASKCYWTHNDATCHFRQAHIPVYELILIATFAGIVSIPIAKYFEFWVMIQACVPTDPALRGKEPMLNSRNNGQQRATKPMSPRPPNAASNAWSKGFSKLVFHVPGVASDVVHPSVGSSRHPNDEGGNRDGSELDDPVVMEVHNHPASGIITLHDDSVVKEARTRALAYITAQSVDGEFTMLERLIHTQADAYLFMAQNRLKHRLVYAWSMDRDAQHFLRSSLVVPPPTNWKEIDDRMDLVVALSLNDCRLDTVEELQYLVALLHGEDVVKKDLTKQMIYKVFCERMLYLWQRDLMGSTLAKAIFDYKLFYDHFYQRYQDRNPAESASGGNLTHPNADNVHESPTKPNALLGGLQSVANLFAIHRKTREQQLQEDELMQQQRFYLFRYAGHYVHARPYRIQWILTLLLFGVVFIGMIIFILFNAWKLPKELQVATVGTFLIWIMLDMLGVAVLEVCVVHLLLPSLIAEEVEVAREKIVRFTQECERQLQTHGADNLFIPQHSLFMNSNLPSVAATNANAINSNNVIATSSKSKRNRMNDGNDHLSADSDPQMEEFLAVSITPSERQSSKRILHAAHRFASEDHYRERHDSCVAFNTMEFFSPTNRIARFFYSHFEHASKAGNVAPTDVFSHSRQVWAVWKLILMYREVLPLGYTDADDHRRHKNSWLRPFLHMLDRVHQIRYQQQQEKKLRIWERRAAKHRELVQSGVSRGQVAPFSGGAPSEAASAAIISPSSSSERYLPGLQNGERRNTKQSATWGVISAHHKTNLMSYFTSGGRKHNGQSLNHPMNASMDADRISPYNDHSSTNSHSQHAAYESIFSTFGCCLMVHNFLLFWMSIRPVYLQEMALQMLLMVFAGCMLFLHWILYNIQPWMICLVAATVLIIYLIFKCISLYYYWQDRLRKRRKLQVHALDNALEPAVGTNTRQTLHIRSVHKAPSPADHALAFEPKPVVDRHEKIDHFDVANSEDSSASVSDSSASSSEEDDIDSDDAQNADIFGVVSAADGPTRFALERPQYYRTQSERHYDNVDDFFSDDEGKNSLDFDLMSMASPQRDFEMGPPSPDFEQGSAQWRQPSIGNNANAKNWIVPSNNSGEEELGLSSTSAANKILFTKDPETNVLSEEDLFNRAVRHVRDQNVDDLDDIVAEGEDDERMTDFSIPASELSIPTVHRNLSRAISRLPNSNSDVSRHNSVSSLSQLNSESSSSSPSRQRRTSTSFTAAVAPVVTSEAAASASSATATAARREEIIRSIAAAQGNVAALGIHLQTAGRVPQRAPVPVQPSTHHGTEFHAGDSVAPPALQSAPKQRVSIGPAITEDGRDVSRPGYNSAASTSDTNNTRRLTNNPVAANLHLHLDLDLSNVGNPAQDI